MNWLSSAVGLGGVGVAVLTLLLTYRSRLSPYQQKLYERQLDAATDVLQALGRYHDEAVSLFDGDPARELDFSSQMAEVKSDFFRSYRRWNVVIPHPVTAAVTAYLQILEEISATEQKALYSPGTPSPGYRLANAYAAVLGAAQRELRVKTLSDKTLGLIESLARQPAEQAPNLDPLYIKAIAESRLFESFVDEAAAIRSPVAGKGDRAELLAVRDRLYVENRNLFLIHAWRPSTREGQIADITIRVIEHGEKGFWPNASQVTTERPATKGLVEKVEYYLGRSFRPAFVKYDATTDFRLDVAAYGPTLCVARVHFTDAKPPVTLYRYLDFVNPEA
jgi:hypothetical protein